MEINCRCFFLFWKQYVIRKPNIERNENKNPEPFDFPNYNNAMRDIFIMEINCGYFFLLKRRYKMLKTNIKQFRIHSYATIYNRDLIVNSICSKKQVNVQTCIIYLTVLSVYVTE